MKLITDPQVRMDEMPDKLFYIRMYNHVIIDREDMLEKEVKQLGADCLAAFKEVLSKYETRT